MIVLISPSKSITVNTPPIKSDCTRPMFGSKTDKLIQKLQKTSETRLTSTLGVSNKLGNLNYERYKNWLTTDEKAAMWTYDGDVYNGLAAFTMADTDIRYAQKHLLIISGLYGLLRPMDAIRPYRLEMRLLIKIAGKKNLYDYWATTLAEYLNSLQDDKILHCASPEYTSAIVGLRPGITTLKPRFMQKTEEGYKEKGLFAKYGRGLLARWVLDNQATNFEEIKSFDVESYKYSKELSTDNEMVFIVPENYTLKGRFIKK